MLDASNLNNIFQSTAARSPPPKARAARFGAATSPSDPGARPWPFPATGKAFFVGDAYSAALATAAFSFSSNASMRRAVACGDFVKRARRL